MAKSSLVEKLHIKPNHRILVLNPPTEYFAALDPLPEGVELHTHNGGEFDFVQIYA